MKILYFVKGQVSTQEAMELKHKYPGDTVVFRDYKRPGNIEGFDMFVGRVPADLPKTEVIEDLESYELPKISDGARKLIVKHEISDSQLATIKPTGKYGIVASDIEDYLNDLL